VRGTFEHRNLFGENETVTVEGFAGTDEQRLESRYRVPQFKRNRQDFVAAAGVRHVEFDAYDESAATVTAGLERQLTRMWDVGAGGLAEISETTDSAGRTTFLLFGVPLFANYDGTRDFLNPTQGWRVRTDLTPFVGITDDDRTPFFVRLDAVASHYIALDDAARYVLAGRARLGAIPAQSVEDVPAGRRLYSGGGGSVRGYAERSIGPRDASNDPTGGLSVMELGAELRARVWGDVGGAVFLEGGSVSEEVYFAFEDLQLATGGGLRYFSPVGPIRFDVGVPLTRRDGDDAFHIYLSIGQAF
jgi:translocation and assembly module TamA